MRLDHFYHRQPLLVSFGALLLLMSLSTFALQFFDFRQLDGVNVWIKPTKFSLSAGVFALTQAFFIGYVQPQRHKKGTIGFVIFGTIFCSVFEVGYITFQAALGQASHFNLSDGFHIVMYALMGIGAVLLTLTMLPLAYEIGRNPVAGLRQDYRFAILAGLVFSTAATIIVAGYMSSTPGHFVGQTGAYMPIMGWNLVGGDLRVSHFFALHAHQAFPLMAVLLGPVQRHLRWFLLLGFMGAYAALTAISFVEALRGMPVLSLLLGLF